MVWNITKDDIRVRMAVVEEHTWAPPLASKAELPRDDDRSQSDGGHHLQLGTVPR